MVDTLCGVCNTEPKKYKCPTCALPYCSLACFQTHKSTHPLATPQPTQSLPSLPQPPPPAPIPRYLKSKTDFSVLATDPKFQDLLKSNPTLLASLQRVYATTIEPDPEEEARRRRMTRGGFRGRGSRGRGGRWGGHSDREQPRWTQKKGDADAMRMLKGFRNEEDGQEGDGMAAFVQLVEEMFGQGEKEEGD
ncbi:hypothetical protein P153DRAFT_287606 [Dothidotthia symphoricarpi CBS 119687]|uniref:HIT-type domain-containing protein n=1 Tax=Dothidotthia symphoricarpi CBS 119687 TaxID=1392245 RepID=A0A6A6AKS2_9PLEO|nr:uncharacterized protein P153DRAFT_287606 [Dothidotthia symphoricarpi CBS 119687]KAF2131041.1 hypothetical protein P153DRAFT_287606 [Dothidotthia symphoricarpi CBS 119687]